MFKSTLPRSTFLYEAVEETNLVLKTLVLQNERGRLRVGAKQAKGCKTFGMELFSRRR